MLQPFPQSYELILSPALSPPRPMPMRETIYISMGDIRMNYSVPLQMAKNIPVVNYIALHNSSAL